MYYSFININDWSTWYFMWEWMLNIHKWNKTLFKDIKEISRKEYADNVSKRMWIKSTKVQDMLRLEEEAIAKRNADAQKILSSKGKIK